MTVLRRATDLLLEILIALVVIAPFAAVWWGFHSSNLAIHLPRSAQEMTPDRLGLPYENVSFLTEDGLRIAGWFVPREGSSKTLVICHGWGAERSNVLPSTFFLHRGGYNLLYFDFRNHGESQGDRSSLGRLEIMDLSAALNYLSSKKTAQSRWIGVWALSMGGAVALTTAADRPEIRAVVAESPFSSYNRALIRYAKLFYRIPRPLTPLTLFFIRRRLGFNPDDYSPIRHIARISPRPLFLIQGDADPRMPPSEGEALYAAAREPKELWTVPGADHGEPYSKDPATYERKVLEFFSKAGQP